MHTFFGCIYNIDIIILFLSHFLPLHSFRKDLALRRAVNLIIYLLILLYIMGYPGSSYVSSIDQNSQNKDTNDCIMQFVETRSEYGDFRLWKNEKVGFRKELHDLNGKVAGHLYNVTNNSNIIGYIIINPHTPDVLEYALGLSPYDAYLSCHNLRRLDNELMFIYNGPGYYGISIKSQGKPLKFLKVTIDKFKGFNPLKHAAKLAKEKNIVIMGSTPYVWDSHMDEENGYYLTEKVLLDVQDFQRYKGCGPTSAANIVYYWDKYYPTLVSDRQKPKQVIEELASRMYTTFSATLPTDFRDGLKSYLNASYRCRGRFDVFWYSDASGKKTYETICSEIKIGRPGAVLYLGSPYWGNHYANFVGYCRIITPKGISNFYIIHDNWDATPVNIYRNWYADEPFIDSIFKVTDKKEDGRLEL